MDTKIDNLLAPQSDPENLNLLVGAGISGNLPGTCQVIQALLRVLFISLGKRTSERIVNDFFVQHIGEQRFSDPIRFEYLLQLVRDYFGANPYFLKWLFETDVVPTYYHRGLAALLNFPGNVILTTNFDRQIEKA